MAEPQGLISFTGVNDILEASYSLTQGISPGVATIILPPQQVRRFLTGDLTIQQGRVRIRFKQCRVDDVEQSIDEQGREVWIIRVLDRRWLWRLCGEVSGEYNIKRGTAAVNVRRPKELAKLCLDAMGEHGFDIRDMPNDSFPETRWDYTNPAEALNELCDALDCRIVLTLKDRVKIVRVNRGDRLVPNNRTLDGGRTLNPADPPGLIAIVGAPTMVQLEIKLRAVGLHPNGSIVPIDELPYTPVVNGHRTWRFSSFEDFQEIRKIEHRGLAMQSVFRWYQIVGPIRLPVLQPRLETRELWRILPLLNHQVELQKTVDGEEVHKPPQVYGRFWAGFESHEAALPRVQPNLTKFPRGEWTDGFSVDLAKGIVKLSQPGVLTKFGQYAIPGANRIFSRVTSEAELWLRIAANVRDKDTRALHRVEWRDRPGGRKADPACVNYVVRDECGLRFWWDYTAGGQLKSTRADAAPIARHYLEIEKAKYQLLDGGAVTQAGFVEQEVDGAIVQVTWSVDGEGYARTRIARTKEEINPGGPFKQRRLFERIDRALKDRDRRKGLQ